MTGTPTRIAILVSGRGSNMLRLVDHITTRGLACDIVLIASNTACTGLDLAAARGLPTVCVDRSGYADRAAQEDALATELAAASAEWVFLAGYMAVLSATFVTGFEGRMLNIHPSLLPRHKGLDTHQRALAAGDHRHGASVHVVTPALDDGPIILQAGLDVAADDTAHSLAGRVLALEHALYPFVAEALLTGGLVIQNGTVQWHDAAAALAASTPDIQTILTDHLIWP